MLQLLQSEDEFSRVAIQNTGHALLQSKWPVLDRD